METHKEYDGSFSLVPYYQYKPSAPATAGIDYAHGWLSLEACALRGETGKTAHIDLQAEGAPCAVVTMNIGPRRALLPVSLERDGAHLKLDFAIRGERRRIDLSPALAGAMPVKLAVFDFELEDATPAAAVLGKATSTAASLDEATRAAREALAASGRYTLVDVPAKAEAKPAHERTLQDCDGCEAAIARESGANQSLIGVVVRVTQTDYYIAIVIRDARTGKVVDAERAMLMGGEESWASGVRMLIKHQILVDVK
jgi:hypothetical protein